jgi:hypothetical protein
VVYRLGEAVASRRAGLFAAGSLVLVPNLLQYALEIRTYSLMGLCVALALLAALRLLQGAANPGAPLRVLPLALACLAVGYSHGIGLVIVAALVICVMLALWRARGLDLSVVRFGLILNAVVGLGLVPQVVATLQIMWTNAETLAFLPPPSLSNLVLVVRQMTMGQFTQGFGVPGWAAT